MIDLLAPRPTLTNRRCRIVFVEATGGLVVIDAVGEDGAPIPVVAQLPFAAWAFAAYAALEKWCARADEVELEWVPRRSGPPRVRLTTDDTFVLLDLVSGAGPVSGTGAMALGPGGG
jgi:hypothetical protein